MKSLTLQVFSKLFMSDSHRKAVGAIIGRPPMADKSKRNCAKCIPALYTVPYQFHDLYKRIFCRVREAGRPVIADLTHIHADILKYLKKFLSIMPESDRAMMRVILFD